MRSDPPAPDADIARRVRRKVAVRILPLIFVLYIVAYLDRANLSFAWLRMQPDLRFSDEAYGFGVGIFFIGYLLLEIPGALIVERWSARKWFARILFSWGLCSMGMALVKTETQFYIARFLLGVAEAGFFPGVIVYFTHWFPKADRGRALAGMVVGIPVSLYVGAFVSGYLLEQEWFGLAGWQWVFLVEGFPAVLLGVAVLFLLTDWPHQAKWLTPVERSWLTETLEAEAAATAMAGGPVSVRTALGRPTVWLLAAAIFATNLGGYALVFWFPKAVEQLLVSTDQEATSKAVLNWMGIIYLFGFVGVLLSGWSSDRTGDRKWHCIAGQFGTGLFLVLSTVPGQSWPMVFAWLCCAGLFAFSWPSPFWALPTALLSSSAAAIAIGFINMCANAAGFVGPSVFGAMRKAGISDRTCLVTLAGCYVLGGVIVSLLPVPGRARPGGRRD